VVSDFGFPAPATNIPHEGILLMVTTAAAYRRAEETRAIDVRIDRTTLQALIGTPVEPHHRSSQAADSLEASPWRLKCI
jgi:hypothetical protein